uniref:Putative metalloprotease n=1 Tax=Ixodes ricinus TaxID=34613 RepID=A0A147BGA5_IXORI
MVTENDELPANFFSGSDYCQVLSKRQNTTTCESPTGPENGAVDTPCQMQCCFENTNVTVNSPDGTRCDNETVLSSKLVQLCVIKFIGPVRCLRLRRTLIILIK